MSAQELIAATSPIIGKAGSAFYFRADTLARGRELNLDGFRFYMLGRGGVLGDVEPDVVASAFGYFSRPLVARIWNSAKERMAPREAARAYMACCANLGRSALAAVDDLGVFCQAAEALTDRLLLGAYGALDAAASTAFLAGTRAIGAALGI